MRAGSGATLYKAYRGRISLIAIATCAAVAALTACDSSSSGSSGSGSAAAGVIVVGALGEFAAYESTAGGIPPALAVWADATNKAGGINGRKVRLITKDVPLTTGANITAARSLISEDKVVAILDFDVSDAAWLKFAQTSSVPVITGLATPAGLASPNLFSATNAVALSYGEVAVAKTLGSKFAVGYPSELAIGGQIAGLFKAFGSANGVDVPVAAALSSSAPDYTSFCQQMKSNGVNSYGLSMSASVAQQIAQQCRLQGIRALQVLTGPNTIISWKGDPAFAGDPIVDSSAPYFDTSVQGIADYRAALSKYAGRDALAKADSPAGAYGWTTAKMLEKALRDVKGDVTGAAVTDALYTFNNETLSGLTAPLTFSKGKTNTNNCWFVWTINSGTVTADKPVRPSCAPSDQIDPVIQSVVKSLAGS